MKHFYQYGQVFGVLIYVWDIEKLSFLVFGTNKSASALVKAIIAPLYVCVYTVCTFILMSRPCFSSSFLISCAPSRAAFSTKCFHSIGWKTWGSWGTYKPIFTWEKQGIWLNAPLLIRILLSYLHSSSPSLPSSLLHPISHLLQGVLVSLVGVLKLGHQFSQRAVGQWFVHQVLAAAHAQRSVATVTVDAQHNVVEAVTRKLSLKADGETLERRQPVCQVAGQHTGVREGSRVFSFAAAWKVFLRISYLRLVVFDQLI